MSRTVEVYQISAEAGDLKDPIHTIYTGACGLNAIETNPDFIFMGF